MITWSYRSTTFDPEPISDRHNHEDDAWRLTLTADLNGRVEASVDGQFALAKDVLGCLRVINERSYPVVVERVTMAKVSLFKR